MSVERSHHHVDRPATHTRLAAALAGAALIGVSLAGLPPAATADDVQPASAPVVVTLTDHGVSNYNCLTWELVHNVHGGGTLALWAAPDGHIKAALVDAAGLASDVVNVTTDETKAASWATCQQVAAAPNPTGGWLVVHSTLGATVPTPVYGRFISEDGVPAPTVLTLTSGTYLASLFAGGGQGNNQISWSSVSERYLLTWTATIPTGNPLLAAAAAPKQVLGRFLDADGVGIGPDFLVTNDADTFVGPHAHARGADRWVVVATRVTGTQWFERQLGVMTITDAGTVSAPTIFGPDGLRGPDVAYNAQLDTFLVTFTEIPDPNTNALATHALDDKGVPVGSTVRVGPGPIHRARVISIGTTGYAIAYWDWPGAEPRTSVIRVDVAGRPIAGAPTAEVTGYVPSIVQQCGTAEPLLSVWSYGDPTDVSLAALDTTGLTATDCLASGGGDDDGDGPAGGTSTTSWVPASDGAPLVPAGRGEWQQSDGSVTPLTLTALSGGRIRYSADGLQVTFTGGAGSSASRGLVVGAEGTITCEVCTALAEGQVIEAWMFSEPRLVAAHAIDGLPCQTFVVPVGSPLDGGGPVAAGAHTLQLALPTASGMAAVNVGVTVGGPVPASVPAGEGPVLPSAWLLAIAGLVVLGAGVLRPGVLSARG